MPDPNLSEAIKEAYASAPADVVTLDTIELLHPAFTQPVRVVRNHADIKTWLALGGAEVQAVLDGMEPEARAQVGLVARLEASAPANPGELVPWIALAFDLDLPQVDTVPVPEATLTVDNVGREVSDQLELAAVSQEKITVIYRPYLSTDIDGPQNDPPLTLILADANVTDMRLSGTARMLDVGNVAFPNETYTPSRFRALASSSA